MHGSQRGGGKVEAHDQTSDEADPEAQGREQQASGRNGFMLCLDTNDEGITTDLLDVSNKWKELRAQNKVSSSLRVTLCLAILKELVPRLNTSVCADSVRQKMASSGWIHVGDQPLDPSWTYLEWNPATKQSEVAKIKNFALMEILTKLQVLLPMDMVLTRLHPTRPLAQSYQAEVLPFFMSLEMRSEEATKAYSYAAAGRSLSPQVDRHEVENGAPNAAAPWPNCWRKPF